MSQMTYIHNYVAIDVNSNNYNIIKYLLSLIRVYAIVYHRAMNKITKCTFNLQVVSVLPHFGSHSQLGDQVLIADGGTLLKQSPLWCVHVHEGATWLSSNLQCPPALWRGYDRC